MVRSCRYSCGRYSGNSIYKWTTLFFIARYFFHGVEQIDVNFHPEFIPPTFHRMTYFLGCPYPKEVDEIFLPPSAVQIGSRAPPPPNFFHPNFYPSVPPQHAKLVLRWSHPRSNLCVDMTHGNSDHINSLTMHSDIVFPFLCMETL
jgi:hypothetical protein